MVYDLKTGSASVYHEIRVVDVMEVTMSRPEPILYRTRADARIDATTDPTTTWADWVDARIAAAIDVNNETVGEAIGDHCGQHVASLKRQIELLEREVNQLRAHVALARGLEELQSEIAAAKSQIPELPKVVERLEAGQSRLRREVAATKEKIGNLRVDTSQINY